jgi:anthranilate phosphoribosyltransferase
LVIAGRAQTVAEGIALARAVIDSGKALAWLQKLRAFALHPLALHRDASERPG